jgi:hypothetical protein
MQEHRHVLLGDLTSHEHARRLLNERRISRRSESTDGSKLVLRCRRVVVDGERNVVLHRPAVLDGGGNDDGGEVGESLVGVAGREETEGLLYPGQDADKERGGQPPLETL